jgi:hypothetical protein
VSLNLVAMKRSLRSVLSVACFVLGAVWGLAAALKLIFGFAVSFPLLPPFGLQQIDVPISVMVSVVLFAAGAVLGRRPVRDGETLKSDTREHAA